MKRKVLGRGIEAIIANKSSTETGKNFTEIDIADIYPNPFQPRKKFSQDKIEKLAQSINEMGMIQPVIAYEKDNKYYLLVGERRWRAAQHLKWKKIPVIIKELSLDNLMIGALVENIQREDLNAIEISEGIDLLLKKTGMSQEKIAHKLGMNRSTVTNYLRLLKLPEIVMQGVVSGEITQGHARAVLSLNNNSDILAAYSQVLKKQLSVRKTEMLVQNFYKQSEKNEKQDDPNVKKIEEKLTRILATKVRLKYSKSGQGKIEIFFSDIEEFERIYRNLFKE